MLYRIAITLLSAVFLAVPGGTGADVTITQRNKAFSIRQLTIQAGDRLTFVNEDDVTHNVYSEAQGSEFDVLQRPGQAFTVRLTQPGVVDVQCAIHPSMRLQVQVQGPAQELHSR